MTNPNEYYFSTPIMSKEEPGFEEFTRPTVVVTSKKIWDTQNTLDYTILGNKYTDLYPNLGFPEFMGEVMENYFQPMKPMTCEDLKADLEKKGFIHNSSLDDLAKEILNL